METNKTKVLSAILEAILPDKNLSFKNVNEFLDEGKDALNELLAIDQNEAIQLLNAFNECETTVEDWKKELKDNIVKGKLKGKLKEELKRRFEEKGCPLKKDDDPTGYQLFKHKNKNNDNLIKINRFVTYCDIHGDGIGTNGYNQKGIAMALAWVFQDAWVKNLLKYRIDKQDKNIDNRVIRAIEYFNAPESYLSIISEKDIELIYKYFTKYENKQENTPDVKQEEYLIKYFNEVISLDCETITDENKKNAYKNYLYTRIIYKLDNEWRGIELINDIYEALLKNKNVILTGAPGTGKTFLARENITKLICGENDFEKYYKFVQFHPTYDYTDFVEGLRPISKDNNIVFERKDGIFKRFCKCAILGLSVDATDNEIKNAEKKENEAKKNEVNQEEKTTQKTEQKYLFIIDEINRGDISKIFGELFFAIDPGYRGEKNKVQTQYQTLVKDDIFSEGFYIPDNVYIIGTMNDIDRSVESLDFAFRRRFAFKEISVKDTQGTILIKEVGKDYYEVIKRMNAINNLLKSKDFGLGEAYCIGAAYFTKIKNYSKQTKNKFESLWDYHLKGVLYEYFRGEADAEDKLTKLKGAYDNA